MQLETAGSSESGRGVEIAVDALVMAGADTFPWVGGEPRQRPNPVDIEGEAEPGRVRGRPYGAPPASRTDDASGTSPVPDGAMGSIP